MTLWDSITQLYRAVDRGRRRQVWLLAFLTAAGAISEMVAIGAVVPFLALLSDQSATDHLPKATRILSALGAHGRWDQLVAATLILSVAAVASGLFRLVLNRATQQFAFGFGHEMSVEIQRRALLQPYSWQVRHNSSEQLATLEKVEAVASMVVLPLVQAAAAIIQIAVVVALLVTIAPFATIIVGLGLGSSYFALGLFARRRLRASSLFFDAAFEDRLRIIQEGLGGVRDHILEGSQSSVLNQFRKVDLGIARARANTAIESALPRYLIEPIGILVIAGLALILSGRPGGLLASLPALGALALGIQRLMPLVQQLYLGWNNMAASHALVQDVVRRLRLAVPPEAPLGPRLPFARSIKFDDVGYAYPDGGKVAVSGLSFTIAAGNRVGLVGPTGSGKSTTADLLMGLLEPASGEISVDDISLAEQNRQAWRGNIAHVPQILFLADTTIAQNIAMAAELDMDRVREAAKLAQLDEFIATLPQGYDSKIGERGARVSGGQRQRLALARAIYKRAPVLVLDEATSALDDETEAAIAAALDALQKQNRTILIIAHRSKLIETCDQIITLKNGRITDATNAGNRRARH